MIVEPTIVEIMTVVEQKINVTVRVIVARVAVATVFVVLIQEKIQLVVRLIVRV